MKRALPALLGVVLLAAACSAGSSGSSPTPSSSSAGGAVTGGPSTEPPSTSPSASSSGPNLGSARVRLQPVARLEKPVALAVRPGDDALYVAEQTGRVMAVRDGGVGDLPVLDLSGEVSGGYEQGLLGLDFSPDGGLMYVDYTDTDGDTHVDEFRFAGGQAVRASRRQVLFVDQPYANHNGGQIAFGPDGYLYVGLGDGGSEGDPDNRGQDLTTLLGKILRIDPHPTGGRGHGIPKDNPFVDRADARGEIWAYGLRNPWRFSFDRETGDLWIGDVGQNEWEEVDFQPSGSRGGENYGWRLMEGTHQYGGAPPPNHVPPIDEYSHDGGGCVVTGGYVYRGQAIPNLRGAYLYGDFCTGTVTAIVQRDGRVTARRTLRLTVPDLSSFGQDGDGELYLLSLEGPLYRLAPG